MRTRVAVLASGGGSNLQALLDHGLRLGEQRAFDVVAVLANRADAGALDRARAHGIAAHVIADAADGPALDARLVELGAELVVLAGYLKLVPLEVVRRFHGRLLNVHPALLPAFGGPGMYGQRVHAAVLEHGARVSGVTVHFVDDAYDRGATAAQWPVPVLPDDTPASLARRVLQVEHQLYPRVVQAVAAGQLVLHADGAVRCAPGTPLAPDSAFALVPALHDAVDSLDATFA